VALQPQPSVTVSGTITDGSGHGWPLYTQIDVAGDPNGPFFTDPVTGHYSIQLPANASYNVTFTSQLSGYQVVQQTVAVGGSDTTHDAQIPVTPDCTAPGYSQGSPCVKVPGGLVEGNVSDLTTGDAINGAQVQSNDMPTEKTRTFAPGHLADLDLPDAGARQHHDPDALLPEHRHRARAGAAERAGRDVPDPA
jgi:hypothetical protein